MRRTTLDDVAVIKRFLHERIESSMFPLANLSNHGLEGTHNRAVTVWIAPDNRGIFSVTNDGMMLPQLPNASDWPSVPVLVRDRQLTGCAGDQAQVSGILAACGLQGAPAEVNSDEPLMRLDISELNQTKIEGQLMQLSKAPLDLMVQWRADYSVEVLGVEDPADALTRAKRDISNYIAADSHRCLLINETPVAMTGFNARYEDTVQIGGVFTPPKLRGRGYAGAALSKHLSEAAQAGAKRAVLFAASETAVGVYRRLGFTRCGTYTLCVFKSPQEVQ